MKSWLKRWETSDIAKMWRHGSKLMRIAMVGIAVEIVLAIPVILAPPGSDLSFVALMTFLLSFLILLVVMIDHIVAPRGHGFAKGKRRNF